MAGPPLGCRGPSLTSARIVVVILVLRRFFLLGLVLDREDRSVVRIDAALRRENRDHLGGNQPPRIGIDSAMPRARVFLGLFLVLCACAEGNEADDLRDQIQADDYRSTYARAPGWEMSRQPSEGGPHGAFIDIYVNDVVEDAIAAGTALEAWPAGSIIVKDGWSAAQGGEYEYLAFMERRDDGWFWGEYRGNGRRVAAGLNDGTCADCHAAGQDSVRAFDLPQ